METPRKYLVMLHQGVATEDVKAITTDLVNAGGQITTEYSVISNTFAALITKDYKQVLDDRSQPPGSKIRRIEPVALMRAH